MIQFCGAICHPASKYSEFRKKIRIITNSTTRDSYRDLLKKIKILPLCSQYIYTISLYIVNNKHLNTFSTKIRNFNTRYIHPPTSNLINFQKRAYYSGIKIFSQLQANIKILMNDLECFHLSLKRFHKRNSFYSLQKFFNYNR